MTHGVQPMADVAESLNFAGRLSEQLLNHSSVRSLADELAASRLATVGMLNSNSGIHRQLTTVLPNEASAASAALDALAFQDNAESVLSTLGVASAACDLRKFVVPEIARESIADLLAYDVENTLGLCAVADPLLEVERSWGHLMTMLPSHCVALEPTAVQQAMAAVPEQYFAAQPFALELQFPTRSRQRPTVPKEQPANLESTDDCEEPIGVRGKQGDNIALDQLEFELALSFAEVLIRLRTIAVKLDPCMEMSSPAELVLLLARHRPSSSARLTEYGHEFCRMMVLVHAAKGPTTTGVEAIDSYDREKFASVTHSFSQLLKEISDSIR